MIFPIIFSDFFKLGHVLLVLQMGKASSTVLLCSTEPNHGEEASRNSVLSKMSLICFIPNVQGCVKLVAIQFWHCYWLFQIKTQQRYQKAMSALPSNSPARSGSFPVASTVTEVFHFWREWGGSLVFFRLSICKISSLPLLFGQMVSEAFSASVSVNWNHLLTMTIGKKHTKIWLVLFIFLIETNKFRLFFFKAEKHCPCTGLFWAGRKSHDPVEGAGLEQAVFQLGLLLVMHKSFLIKLSSKLKLTIETNRKFLWPKSGAQGVFSALVHGVFFGFQVSLNQPNTFFLKLNFDYKK